MSRLSAHIRAVMSVVPPGLAYGHHGNPAASLRLERLYGCPVLLSGLASLVLNKSEVAVVHHHHKINLERLLKLHRNTPECVVMFLAGSLPVTALLHLRMLSLLGMIARLALTTAYIAMVATISSLISKRGPGSLQCAPSALSMACQTLCLPCNLHNLRSLGKS